MAVTPSSAEIESPSGKTSVSAGGGQPRPLKPDLLHASGLEFNTLTEIVAKQQALGKRLLWLLFFPLVIAISIIPILVFLHSRLNEVELGTKLITIERVLDRDKNYPWAIDQYEAVARTHPSAPIFARLGFLYFELDQKNEGLAIAKLKEAENLDPSYWEIFRELTYIYTLKNKSALAIEAGNKALSLNRLDANTYNNLAWVYATSQDPNIHNLDLALEYANKAVNLSKAQQPDFLDTLAEIHIQKGGEGERDTALAFSRVAIEIAPYPEKNNLIEHFKRRFPNESLKSVNGG